MGDKSIATLQLEIADYIRENNGKYIDFDGVYGSQCVDYVVDFIDKVFATPKNYSVGSAKNFWYYFEQIATLRNNFVKVAPADMRLGDIVIFDWKNPSYPHGHCAVFVKNLADNAFQVAQEDGAIDKNNDGLADGVAHFFNWKRDFVLGALRHKSVQSAIEAADAVHKAQQAQTLRKEQKASQRMSIEPKAGNKQLISDAQINKTTIKGANILSTQLERYKIFDDAKQMSTSSVIGTLGHQAWDKLIMDFEKNAQWLERFHTSADALFELLLLPAAIVAVFLLEKALYRKLIKNNPEPNIFIEYMFSLWSSNLYTNKKLEAEKEQASSE